MAIRHEDVAVGRNRNPGRPVKRIGAIPGDAWRSDPHQYFAGRTDLQDFLSHRDALRVPGGHAEDGLLVVCVGRPDVPVVVEGESVRVGEEPDAEALEQPARRIEFQNRRVGIASIETRGVTIRLVVEAAVKNPNTAVRGDMYPDHLSPL